MVASARGKVLPRPQAPPRFYLDFSPRLRDKIWVGPGDEARQSGESLVTDESSPLHCCIDVGTFACCQFLCMEHMPATTHTQAPENCASHRPLFSYVRNM